MIIAGKGIVVLPGLYMIKFTYPSVKLNVIAMQYRQDSM